MTPPRSLTTALGTARVTSFASAGESPGEVEERCYDWSRRLRRQAVRGVERSGSGKVRSVTTRADHERNVRRALDYIAAGDVFQVNLSQRFEAEGRFEPLDLYLRLKRRSPAPFACYLAWDDLAVVGSSPEWYYATGGGRIVTRPIKGTRPRGQTAEDDARLARELQDSPKDRAELTMIVDLERNDLGRICEFGSVRVVDAHSIESFAQVHHLVATVEGRLRGDVGPVDVVRAMFPGGSITAPPRSVRCRSSTSWSPPAAACTPARSAISAAAASPRSTSPSAPSSSKAAGRPIRWAGGSSPTRTRARNSRRPWTKGGHSAK